MIVGSSLLVVAGGRTSWLLGFAAAGVLMIAVGGLNAAVMPHPPEHHPQDGASPKPAAREGRAFLRRVPVVSHPAARRALVLSFLLFYRLGDIMMFAMSKPLLRDIGVDTAHRGMLNGVGWRLDPRRDRRRR